MTSHYCSRDYVTSKEKTSTQVFVQHQAPDTVWKPLFDDVTYNMDAMESGDSDQEITGNEYEELCKNCDKLCRKLADPVLPLSGRFKKDSRVWLHKNPGFKLGQSIPLRDDSSECLYSVMDMHGRKYKKDSRTWLHKSSRKRRISAEDAISERGNENENKSVDSRMPKRPPAPFVKREPPKSPLRTIYKNAYSFNRENSKQYFTVSNIIRKRKKQSKQFSYSANNSPNEMRYNEEICRILSDELNGNNIRRTVSEEMFEIFDDDDEGIETTRQTSDHNGISAESEWRETRAITSDTSTQSSNENQQMSVNHSPLSSGASINLSLETTNVNKARLISTASNGCVESHFDRDSQNGNVGFEVPGSGNQLTFMNGQSDFSANSCSPKAPLNVVDARRLNMNSRSVCFLIAESDEFLAEDGSLMYDEDSDYD